MISIADLIVKLTIDSNMDSSNSAEPVLVTDDTHSNVVNLRRAEMFLELLRTC